MRILLGILLGVLIVAASVAVVAATGAYNVAASSPPSKAETRFAFYAARKSIERRAPSKPNPFSGPEAVKAGLPHYKENCVLCHGAPGVPESEVGMGLNPAAPDLTVPEIQKMTDGELFWVVSHGIRMSGMPAFSLTHDEAEIWRIVAFVRHLPEITTEEQTALKAGREEEAEHHEGSADKKTAAPPTPATSPRPHR